MGGKTYQGSLILIHKYAQSIICKINYLKPVPACQLLFSKGKKKKKCSLITGVFSSKISLNINFQQNVSRNSPRNNVESLYIFIKAFCPKAFTSNTSSGKVENKLSFLSKDFLSKPVSLKSKLDCHN